MALESLDFLALNADTPVAKAKVGCKGVRHDKGTLCVINGGSYEYL